jgi:hypothetical protein
MSADDQGGGGDQRQQHRAEGRRQAQYPRAEKAETAPLVTRTLSSAKDGIMSASLTIDDLDAGDRDQSNG